MTSPIISGTVANQSVADQATIAPFSGVQIIDQPTETEDVTVTLSNSANGTLNVTGNGSYDSVTGVYTDSGTPNDVTADLQALTFIPNTGVAGQSVTTGFAIAINDSDTESASDNTTSVNAIAGPAIIGTLPGQTTTNQTQVAPFSNVAIADDASQTESVTISLSNAGDGALSGGGGSYDSGTGIYTFSGSASQVTTDIEGLVFTPTQGSAGQTVTTTFTITDVDTLALSATDSATSVDTTAGPVISGTAASQPVTDLTTIAPFASVLIEDDPSQSETVTITLSDPTSGALGSGSGSYNSGTGTYTVSSTAADVTADLRGLIFTPTTGTPGQAVTTTFSISLTDTASITVADSTTTVIATAGPAITGTTSNQAVSTPATITPFLGVMIADDPNQIETVTVTLSNPANGSLTNGSGSYDSLSGIYTVTGTAADVTTDLQGLVFNPAAGTPGQSVTTTFTINDVDTASATATDNATSVIATPLTVPLTILGTMANQSVTDLTTIAPFANVAIADDVSQTETLVVTLSNPADGIFTNLGNGSYDAVSGIYTTTGSAASVTTDLAGLVFNPTQGTPGLSVTTTFTISDTNGSSTNVSDATTSVVTTSGPAITGTVANQAVTTQTTIAPFVTVTIADNPTQTETLTVTLSDPANGSFTNLGNGSYDVISGVYTTTGSAADVTTDLQGLIFHPATGTPGQSVTTTFTISDIDAASASATDSVTSVIAAAGPAISGTVANQSMNVLVTIAPFATVVIADDPNQTETITVMLSNPANGILTNLGNGSYDSLTGTYTTTGSAAAVTTDLQGLSFNPAAGTPGQSVTTTFTISGIDTALATASDATTSVIVAAGPAISGALANRMVTDQSMITPFANVVIADDPSEIETVTVTLSDPANGSLINLGNGSYDAVTGIYTTSGFAASVTTDLDSLEFVPATGIPGQGVTTTFTISDTDTSLMTATDSTTSVLAIAGPAITGAAGGQMTTGQTTIMPFTGVSIADDSSQTETVTVVLSHPANGALTGGSGSYDSGTGTYTVTGTAAFVTTDLQGLVFNPAAGTPGQGASTTFTITATDTSSLTAINSTTSVLAIAGPAITGAVANQITPGQTPVSLFSGVMIADDPSQTETVTVTLSNPTCGSLSNLGNGSYDAVTGTYTVTGTATGVTTDLHNLLFTPVAGTPGQGATTGFTITDTDTSSLTATEGTTSVLAIAGPAISGTVADQATSDVQSITPFTGVVIDDDASQSETVTVTLSNHNNGTLGGGTGSYNSATGTYTVTGTAADVTTDLHSVVFTPAAGIPGQSVTTTFTIADTDTATATATDSTTSVVASSANPSPTISGTVAHQMGVDLTRISPFAHVLITDDPSQTETVTVTLSSHTAGTLTQLGNGSYNASTGVYTTSGSASAVTSDLIGLVFTPASGVAGHAATTTFTIDDIDTALVTASDSATSVVSIAGPAISGVTTGHEVTNHGSVTPFTGVTVTDDISQTETLTVTLSVAAHGSFSHLGNGSYDALTGVYTTTGSAAAVTTDLHGLMFNPASGVPGRSASTSFAISVNDTAHIWANDTTTDVAAHCTAASDDFTDDGTSDILFEHSSGLVLSWHMSNGAISASNSVAGVTPDWDMVGTGRFHGTSTSDILFQNNISGLVLDWQLSNGNFAGSTAIAGVAAGWQLIGIGDFSGDGTSDILFEHTQSGLLLDWQMSGGEFASAHSIAVANFDWRFVGTGDFNGDGTSDILFQNSNSGLLLDWQMSGNAQSQSTIIAGANQDWQIAGTGDFTGDGTSDILFQNVNSGTLLYWEMSAGSFAGSTVVGNMAPGQRVAAIGDYNGDGTDDILIGSNTGSISDWQMSHGTLSKQMQIGGASSDWHIHG
jgi:hypothetical protein